MTAKRRQRNQRKQATTPSLKRPAVFEYRFHIDGKTVIVKAENEETAELIFKAAYGLDIRE